MISYMKPAMMYSKNVIENVYLEGKLVGAIRKGDDGYYYAPRNSNSRGSSYPSVDEVKASLEAN